MRQTVCRDCGKPCEVITGYEEVDGECWGRSGNHRIPVDISECCLADVREVEISEEEEEK